MKINWGTGIIIAFGLFMAFILSFVYKVQSNQKYDNELVTEEYYKKEATVPYWRKVKAELAKTSCNQSVKDGT